MKNLKSILLGVLFLLSISQAWSVPQKVRFKDLSQEQQKKIKEVIYGIYPFGVDMKELLWMNPGSMDQVFKATLGPKNGNQILSIRVIGRPDYGKKRTLERSRMAAELGVGAPVYGFSKDASVLITKWIEGEEIQHFDSENTVYLEKLIDALRLFHHRYQHIKSFPDPYSITERCKNRVKELVKDFPSEKERLTPLFGVLDQIEKALKPYEMPQPIHGDINRENVLITPQKEIVFIDWGDSVTSDLYDDLGAFAHHFKLEPDQEIDLLRSYLKREPLPFEVSKLYMKRLCALLHHAAWAFMKFYKITVSHKKKETTVFPWKIESNSCFSIKNPIKEDCLNSRRLEKLKQYQGVAFFGFEKFLCEIKSQNFKKNLDVLLNNKHI